jgi:hypothetical protein
MLTCLSIVSLLTVLAVSFELVIPAAAFGLLGVAISCHAFV